MPTVNVGHETYSVDNMLYSDFLAAVAGAGLSIEEYFAGLTPFARHALDRYIAYRLAEVDPGFMQRFSDDLLTP